MASVLIAMKRIPTPALLLSILFFLLSHHQKIHTVHADSKVHIVYTKGKGHEDPTVVMNSHHDMLATVLGSEELASVALIYSYPHGVPGFAAKLTVSQAQKISELPDVVHVMPNKIHKVHTTRSWDFLGLDPHSPTNILSEGNKGDGVIIGVIDTGIWPESKSFSDEGLGPIPSRWKGSCTEGELFNATNCNRKLIGARWYIKGLSAELGTKVNLTGLDFLSARDAEGHGTHTSATAAGSFVSEVSFRGLGLGTARGGAPRARLATYKACWRIGFTQCTSADILKAFDDAIHDGVDVLSLSLGRFSQQYFEIDEHNDIAIGSFHAVEKGITVVCSAGNYGPSANSVTNTAPWIITVGASTIDRAFPTVITLGNNRTIKAQGMLTGHKETGFVGLLIPEGDDAGTLDTSFCEEILPDNKTMTGNVVLCFAGSPVIGALFAESAVKEGGGVGLIIVHSTDYPISPCSLVPCVHVDYEIGTQILYYIRSSRSPMVKLSPSKTLVGKPLSTKVAYFSSRGPNPVAPAILKPDIAAPGVNILAAVSPFSSKRNSEYAFLSGTSMSCPHISGIAALLKSTHPSWSPAAIKSALVTTASTTDESGGTIFADADPLKVADPLDYGGGIVNPNRSADPGLIYDMGATDYIQYLCSMGYNNSAISKLILHPTVCPIKQPSILDLNLPSITIPNLKNSVTISRTVTNVGPINSVYNATIEPPPGIHVTVQPHILIFNSTAKNLSFTVTLTSTHMVLGGYYFGSLSWSDGVRIVRSPISVKPNLIASYVDGA